MVLNQTNAVFYPTAITSLVAACVGASLLLRVLTRLNRSASVSSQSGLPNTTRSEVGKIVMGYMVSLFLAACIPGVVQMVTVLLMRGNTSVELQGIVCWPLGFSLYFFLLNGHLWSMGLAARIYMTLLRLAPDEKKRKRGQKFLSWLTGRWILFYSVLINTGYALLVTIYSASLEPHQFVVVGGGCWSGAPSRAGDWIIMTPMVCFLTVELWLFVSARKIVNAQGAKIPELVSSTFWEVLQFTGAVLCCDVLLCATLVCDHSYRLSAENPSTEVVSALVTIETITISVYPMTVALLFLLTSSSADRGHALADKRMDKGRFVVFTQQVSDGSGELWRAAQETLIQQREGEMEGLFIPKIQDWKEENVSENFDPLKLNCNCK